MAYVPFSYKISIGTIVFYETMIVRICYGEWGRDCATKPIPDDCRNHCGKTMMSLALVYYGSNVIEQRSILANRKAKRIEMTIHVSTCSGIPHKRWRSSS